MKPGIHTLSAEDYHRDPADQPSLSASMASILCTSSPAHARAAHPRLNPDYARQHEEKFDLGIAAHALLLEGKTAVEVIDAPDWRTKWAQEARDLARSHSRLPLLGKNWDDVQTMVNAASVQLEAHGARPVPFTQGKPEKTLVWQEDDVWCRARLDWLRDDFLTIDDYKTTSRSANPESWSRTLFNIGCDIQAAFYLRGLKAITSLQAEWRWVVQETSPPYALSVVAPGPDVLALAEAKVDYALEVWKRCLAEDTWPAYPTQVCFAELPAYEEARWLAREAREEMAA